MNGMVTGEHPFRRECFIEGIARPWCAGDGLAPERFARLIAARADDAHAALAAGACPRCMDEFEEGESATGSRTTSCRCIPICERCAAEEANEGLLSQLWVWPVRGDHPTS